jgi:hypothetical protein
MFLYAEDPVASSASRTFEQARLTSIVRISSELLEHSEQRVRWLKVREERQPGLCENQRVKSVECINSSSS